MKKSSKYQENYLNLIDFWQKNYIQDYEHRTANNNRMKVALRALYSYNTVIATIEENKNGEKAIFLNTYRYSQTTSRHQTMIREKAIYPIVESTSNGNFDKYSYISELKLYFQKIKRARSERTIKELKNKIKKTIQNMKLMHYYTDTEFDLTEEEINMIMSLKFITG